MSLQELINQGKEIRDGITYQQAPSGMIRLYSVYRLQDVHIYERWNAFAKRLLRMNFAGDPCINDFEKASSDFEKGYRNPSLMDRMIGILEACNELPSANILSDEILASERKPLLFISHSSEDIGLVEALVTLLCSLGFNKGNLFCSSVEGYGISEGEDIYDTLRLKFQQREIFVVFVLSQSYYKSPACLNEMGAAWILQTNYSTIVAPGFTIPEIKGAINPRKISIIMDDPRHVRGQLNNFKDRLIKFFKLDELDDDIVWENNRNKFLKSI